MSRYNNSGSQNGGSNSGDDYDDITIKLQKYAALSFDAKRVGAFNSDYGDKFIFGFDNTELLDGVVFQREDKPETFKVFSAGKWFNLNEEDGLVYERYDEENDTYENQMSAQDIIEHPRVVGFSETFGGTDYFYKPVGVVIEAAEDIAIEEDTFLARWNDEEEGQETLERARKEKVVPLGEGSMLLSNKSWVRTLAKKLTKTGDSIIADGDDAYETYGWLTEMDPELRDDLQDRRLELWITEETSEWDDGSETTYTTPNVLDQKTEEFVTIDNGLGEDDDSESSDDSTQTNNEQGQQKVSEQEADDAPAADPDPEPEASADGGLPEDVPEVLDELIDYFARNEGTDTTVDDIRDFAESEVDDPSEVDWEAVVSEVHSRA